MKEFDYKKSFIVSMPTVYSSDVTFITAAGMFSGKIANIKKFEFEDQETFSAKLKEIAKTEDIKLKSLVLTAVDVLKKEFHDARWKNTDGLIHLEEVTFISTTGQETNLPEITVAVNQIIAVFSGKVSASK